MSEGWAAFLGEHHTEESPAEQASRLAAQQAGRQDRRALLEEAERRAAAEDEHDRRLVAFQQAGVTARSAAEIFADASRIGDEDAEYEAARAVMAKIERHRRQRAEAMRYQAGLVEMASRSAPSGHDLLAGAKATLARMQVDAMLAAGAPPPRRRSAERRPFISRGAVAVRSELECWHCVQNNVDHETSTLLHLDPQSRVPITTKEQAEQLGLLEQEDRAQEPEYRSEAGGRTPMIYR